MVGPSVAGGGEATVGEVGVVRSVRAGGAVLGQVIQGRWSKYRNSGYNLTLHFDA